MPNKERYLSSPIEKYLKALERGGKGNERTVKKYRRLLTQTMRALQEAGLRYTPKKIGEDEIEYLRTEHWAHLKPSTNRWQLSIFGKFLRYFKNFVVDDMMIAWPQDNRINVDWLSPEEAVLMLEAARGEERILIHLELRLGLRRIEVRRLAMKDIKENILDVHGKGRGGGKWRTLAWAPDTLAEIQYYEGLRGEMIEEARKRDPAVKVPERFFIYRIGRKLGAYGDTSIDNKVKAVARKAGIQRSVSNHTLRRTFGRISHYAGVPLEEIMEAFGHSDTKQTIRYLGLTVDDLARAQEEVYSYLQQVKERMKETVAHAPAIRVAR